MSRRLLILNALLVTIALLCVTYIARELIASPRSSVSPPRPAAPAPPPASRAPTPTGSSPSRDASVAARNLFSPHRTDAPPPVAAASVPTPRKPHLHGVLIIDDAPTAYLEDPTTKRVAGYVLGDVIAGGTVQTITMDRVVIRRPEGTLDVLLHDPTRPRLAAQPPSPVPSAPAGLPLAAAGSPPGPAPVIRRPLPVTFDATPR